jgi:superfamily II DNA/RNA helicase
MFIDEEIVNYEYREIGDLIPQKIVQEVLYCNIPEKNDILERFLNKSRFQKVLLFCNTKMKCELISNYLNSKKIYAKQMNANLEQKERENHLNLFKKGKINVLVATDISARGLHIEDINCIINYDVPTRSEFYVHRIGRTGREGKKGYSLTFICPEDKERFEKIKENYHLDFKMIDKEFDIMETEEEASQKY